MPPIKTLLAVLAATVSVYAHAEELAWPEVSQETKPWSRWWWQGSAVNESDLASLMETYADAGIGGLEITPIYGVRGYEDLFIDYLSPEWVDMLAYSLEEAKRLGLGIDMATGTGWPFGGPMVSAEDACRFLASKTYSLQGGESLSEAIVFQQEPILRTVSRSSLQIADLVEPIANNQNLQALALDQVRFPKSLPLQALMAFSDDGRSIELTDRISSDGKLDWVAPEGTWTLYAIFMGWHGKMVERAAPGGEGNVIDHFDREAIRSYLDVFDQAFDGQSLDGLRAFFNDSYEVDDASGQADWTPRFFEEFQTRRGYDLRQFLPALFGKADADTNARALGDFRTTTSELLLDTFTTEWGEWARARGSIIRNQAHGSPANILDLYAASDIPETESMDPLRVKWAASAGSVSGKKLVAAEAATWLNEHFQPTLNDVRQSLDHFFLNGVNHIVYHGTNYSPSEASWPGWLFYAATHFNERNSWWPDFHALNRYVTRVQSFLQQGAPDNDILLYFPAYSDFAERSREMLKHYGEANQRIEGSNFLTLYHQLNQSGFSHDFISDRQLQATTFSEGELHTEGNRYKTIVVPEMQFIELESFEKLLSLARSGATVIFHRSLPKQVAGLYELDTRQKHFQELKAELSFSSSVRGQIAAVGDGVALVSSSINPALEAVGATRESLLENGLDFARRRIDQKTVYFLANRSGSDFAGWTSFTKADGSAALFDPMSGKSGYTKTRLGEAGQNEVYLEIPVGESLILLNNEVAPSKQSFAFYQANGEETEISGNWIIDFLQGGPELPESQKTDELLLWNQFEGEAYESFSGTAAYSTNFRKPKGKADAWLLDLGELHQSASVYLNGELLETLIGPNYRLVIPKKALKRNNHLEVRVSNRMANHIASLDRNGVAWKKFYNINFPSRLSENRGEDGLFTAEAWEPAPSGIKGPVTLTPLETKSEF